MKILVLNPILFTPENDKVPANATIKDTMIYGMCLGFKQLGHEVTLGAMKEYMPTQKEQYDFEVLWFRNNLEGKVTLSLPCSMELYRWLKVHRDDYDLVISSEAFSFNSLFAARLCPEKTLIWHELALHQKKWHHLPSKFWYRFVVGLFFRKVHCVVARSVPARQFIRRYMRRVSEQTVGHGINTEKFSVSEHKEPQFIIAAQLIARKNIDLIIDRFSRLIALDGFEHYKLLIAGRGPLEEQLKAKVRDMGLERSVEFLGFLDHTTLNYHMSRSVASLMLTSQDNNPVAITESVVCGTPVITNMLPNTAPFVAEHQLGIARDDWNEQDMAEVAKNPKYAQNCIAMRDYLSYRNAAKRLVDIFNSYPAGDQ